MALTKVTGAGVEGVTISSTTDVSDQFILTNTNTGSSSGPDLVLFRQSTSSAADSDGIGRIDYRGLNDANEEINYATTYAKISDASDGTEDGEFYIQQISGGSYVTTLKIDGSGAVTKPLQPAFLAHPSSTVTDMAVNTTHTLLFQTEVADRNSDFDGSTGIFTAPVTGLYHFSALLRLQEMNHGYSIVHCKLITSNSSNYIWIMDMRFGDANPDYFPIAFSTMADMDAGDTAKLQLFIPNYGSAQVDFREESWFSGYLVC